jgi:hypothetical protein
MTLAARRGRPSGFDLLVVRLSLAMLHWARRRAARGALSREEHSRRFVLAVAAQRREHAARLLGRPRG